MKKIALFTLILSLLSCTYDEIPAGKAIVTAVRIRQKPITESRTYKITLKPLNVMDYNEVMGIWNDTRGFIIYTDSLLTIGDTIDILK